MQTEHDPLAGGADAETMPVAPADPAAQIAQLTAERDDMRDRWMRAEAEMQNLRTRTRRDVEDARQYSVSRRPRTSAAAYRPCRHMSRVSRPS